MTLPKIENDIMDGQKVLFKAITKSGWMVITERDIDRRCVFMHSPHYHGFTALILEEFHIIQDSFSHLPTTADGWKVAEGVTVYDGLTELKVSRSVAMFEGLPIEYVSKCTVSPKGEA